MLSQNTPKSEGMRRSHARRLGLGIALSLALLAVCGLQSGCANLHQWWHNGLKVGPDYGRPVADVAETWIDAEDSQLSTEPPPTGAWWSALNDPMLDHLERMAAAQNLSLQIAAMRVLEARAQRGVAGATLFPQQQQMMGAYTRNAFSGNAFPFGQFPIKRFYDDWLTGFDVAWELDVWGLYRRGIEAAEANVNAQIENYDDMLVILQADVAGAYIQMRTVERRLQLMRQNVALQKNTLHLIQRRFEQGIVSELDVRQAKAIMEVTESEVPKLEAGRRTLANTLCILLGIPPGQLQSELKETAQIPVAPTELVVGIPADLLRRRPDVRRAERQAAAQCARVGMATADLYPHFAITGTIALDTEHFKHLFDGASMMGKVGPGFRWNILHYGRIRNRIRAEDAKFQQAVLAYQNTVLAANKEAEDAIVAFLHEQTRIGSLNEAEQDTRRALEIGLLLYQQGVVDYQRVLDAQRALVIQQDALAESQGNIALNLVAVYKAMGGGWNARLQPEQAVPTPAPTDVPVPAPTDPTGPIRPTGPTGDQILTPEQILKLAPPK